MILQQTINLFTSDMTMADCSTVLAHLESLVGKKIDCNTVPTAIVGHAASLTVVHVPDLKVFNVCGDDGFTQAVRLFPTPKCTCPSSTTCCHVIAARRSVGLDVCERKPLNLTELRKNSRYVVAFLKIFWAYTALQLTPFHTYVSK